MNRTTGEVAKVRDALGSRYAGLYDAMPSHTPRDAVLDATRAARAAGADLIVTFGGGSLTDAGKLVRLALQHGIDDLDGFDAYRSRVGADGVRRNPEFDGPAVPQVCIPTTLSAGDFNATAGCTDLAHARQAQLPPPAPRAARHHPRPGADGAHAAVGLALHRHPRARSRHGRHLLAVRESDERHVLRRRR